MELINVKTLKSYYQFTFLHDNEKNKSTYSIFIFIKKHRLNSGYNPGNIFLNATCYSFMHGRSESCKRYFDLSNQQIDNMATVLRLQLNLYKRNTKKMLNIFLNHELTKKVVGF